MKTMKVGVCAVAGTMSAVLLMSACSTSSVEGPVQSKQIEDCKSLSMEPMASVLAAPAKPGPSGGGGKPSSGGSKTGISKPSKPNGSTGGSGSTGDSGKKSEKSKTCTTEYELVVNDKEDGLVEQDVTSEEYDRCEVGEKYPLCKEN